MIVKRSRLHDQDGCHAKMLITLKGLFIQNHRANCLEIRYVELQFLYK